MNKVDKVFLALFFFSEWNNSMLIKLVNPFQIIILQLQAAYMNVNISSHPNYIDIGSLLVHTYIDIYIYILMPFG